MTFIPSQSCGGDLVDLLKRLADYDTIEELEIIIGDPRICSDTYEYCTLQEDIDMKHFNHLKEITIAGYNDDSVWNGSSSAHG